MFVPCIQELHLKNFRCFKQADFIFDTPVVLIEGANGSGKTSLLEAIHYLCYVRSFRTHIPSDLVHFESDTFFIGATICSDTISIGSTGARRQIKINQKSITSYEELRAHCRVVTVTQEDIEIVKASPEKRRSFLDHALVLHNPELTKTLKQFRHVLETRNAFLVRGSSDTQEFDIWTQALWTCSREIQNARKTFLADLLLHARELEGYFLSTHDVGFEYTLKQGDLLETYEQFCARSKTLFDRERYYRRSLFGAHLDDLEIVFNGRLARTYCSRGQQKLLTLFLKLAQVASLKSTGAPLILLVDDFLSDFDSETLKRILKVSLSLNVQVIFTTPLSSGPELIALNDLGLVFSKISI